MAVPSTTRFSIRRRLGEGGMGIVYEAFDEERRATVALKTLSRCDGAALARFKREFRALQGIAHPNLVALDELLFENDQWFFTMELLDGVDFVSHVRGSGPRVAYQSTVRVGPGELAARAHAPAVEEDAPGAFDEPKLRDGLRQLLEGLAALHAADKVHRDVKPSNVLVTREGRVVLLDFGLVTEASAEDRSTGSAVVGTPAYMAPEQAASREVGPAADLYAVGVMLYEALTGRLPIEGAQLQMLIDKQTKEPARPASIAAGVPADLDALCVKLLRFDPAQRPSAADLLRVLAVPVPRASSADLRRTSTDAPMFVGRIAELAVLRAAYAVCESGHLSTVLVCGESGIGKSHLVRQFTTQLLAEHPVAMLLEGRCYERETVPYKTLDGVVDALGSRLARLAAHEVATILPARSAVLGQVFPALLRIPQVAKEHAATALSVDAHQYRQRAFLALRDLFTRIATRRPTVIVIDDLQWADDDGLRALTEILRPPDAPPLLLIGTVRAAAGKDDAGLARLRAMTPGETRVIELATLGADDARELARAVLRRADNPDADPEKIASEAGGHPLFVEELARHVAVDALAPGDVKLDGAIWSRIGQLDDKTREIAELVAIAGKPVPQRVVAAAARVEPGEFSRRSAVLRVANVVRTGGARWGDAIEPYHDRVREAVVGRLQGERRRGAHEALAIAFEASSHEDAEALATHWREAGNPARATRYAIAAGDHAAKAFAFDRAAQWYEQALELLPEHDPARRELHAKLGDVLANAGRGALAAPHLEKAAAESPPTEGVALRLRAADQLIRSGQFDRGIEAMRVALRPTGMRLPTTLLGKMLLLVYGTTRVALRGLRFRERPQALVEPETLALVDTCLDVGTTLAFTDTIAGMTFIGRGLRLALDAGEVRRVIRALLMAAIGIAFLIPDGVRRAQRFVAVASPLVERVGGVDAEAHLVFARGMILWVGGQYRDGVAELERALALVKRGTKGLRFEASGASIAFVGALMFLGRFKDQRRRHAEALREAVARGDVFTSVTMRIGDAVFTWLADDRPDLAEQNTTAALDAWSKRGFHLEHFNALLGTVSVRLYVGDTEGAHSVARDLYEKTRRSILWRSTPFATRTMLLRASAALAMLGKGKGDRGALIAEASECARLIDRRRGALSWLRAFATSVRAGVALHRGEREEAVSILDETARDFAERDRLGYAAAARYHAAGLRGDAAEKQRALDYFRGEEVVAPARMIRTLIAGFPE